MRFLALTLLLAACGTLGGTPDTDAPIDWPDIVRCGPRVSDVVGEVSQVLLDADTHDTSIPDRSREALEALARKHGPDTVACLVDTLIKRWTAPGATQSPDRASAAARGRDFLGDVGVNVQVNEAQ